MTGGNGERISKYEPVIGVDLIVIIEIAAGPVRLLLQLAEKYEREIVGIDEGIAVGIALPGCT